MGYGLDWDRELLAKADKLNAQDIQAVAAKYLDPDKAYLLKVTP
jgi:predicted Zn-dependent peptidase